MNKIKYLKHCTYFGKSVLDIFSSGYIKSSKELDEESSFGDENIIFVQAVYKDDDSISYVHKNNICILLSPKLLEDMDFVYNPSWVGWKKDDSIPKKKYFKLLKTIKPKSIKKLSNVGRNEILFDKKIPIKKYIIGVIINILFDSKTELRPDIAESCQFKVYFHFIKQRNDKMTEKNAKSIFLFERKVLRKIREYTDNIKYDYLPFINLFPPEKGRISCYKYSWKGTQSSQK